MPNYHQEKKRLVQEKIVKYYLKDFLMMVNKKKLREVYWLSKIHPK